MHAAIRTARYLLVYCCIAAVLNAEGSIIDPDPPVWPEVFHSLLFQNRTGKLAMVDLWYDWPGGRNLNLIHRQQGPTLHDLEWTNGTSFYYDLEAHTCKPIGFPVGILRPNWLQNATYLGFASDGTFSEACFCNEILKSLAKAVKYAQMTTAQTLQAIIRAARPKFRNKHDRVAFAVHAYMLGEGYKLVAVGKDADESKSVKKDAPEVDLDGWNEAEVYAFNYVDASGKRPPVMVKAVPIENKLAVNFLEPTSDRPPTFVELDVDLYTTSSDDPVDGYKDLDGLAKRLQKALAELRPKEFAPKPTTSSLEEPLGASGGAQAVGGVPLRSGGAEDGQKPLRPDLPDPLRVDPRSFDPRGIVDDPADYYGDPDLLPPGIPRDVTGLMRGGPELAPPGTRPAFPGGMHVGPDDPLFQPRHGRPGMGLPGQPGPGIRWDPIAPEGIPGFNPEDFQPPRGPGRGGPGIHPDVMQPGPGGGPFGGGGFGGSGFGGMF